MTKPIRVDYDRVERHEFEIYKESILQRLDIYIHTRMPDYSRTLVQKLIKDGMITVNGRPLSCTVRPTTSRRPPKRRCQRP